MEMRFHEFQHGLHGLQSMVSDSMVPHFNHFLILMFEMICIRDEMSWSTLFTKSPFSIILELLPSL